MASSSYYAGLIDSYNRQIKEKQKEIKKLKSEVDDLSKFLVKIKEANKLVLSLVPKFEKMSSLLEYVRVDVKPYDEGYFSDGVTDLNTCSSKFDALIELVELEIRNKNKKIARLNGEIKNLMRQKANAETEYNNALKAEAAANSSN